MEKIAIFVEGQTELIFVREYLLKTLDIQTIAISCEKLYADFSAEKVPYEIPNDDAQFQFFIYNTGNDEAVLKRLIQRLPFLRKNNFTKIIGLRDMYSEKYEKMAKSKVINANIIANFIAGANETIQEECEDSSNVHFCFAIMEIEAWFLNLHYVFECIDARLTKEFIAQELGWDIDNECAEQKFFNPANNLERLYEAVGNKYDKHAGDIEAIMKELAKSDFEQLYQSDKSPSFRNFVDILKN